MLVSPNQVQIFLKVPGAKIKLIIKQVKTLTKVTKDLNGFTLYSIYSGTEKRYFLLVCFTNLDQGSKIIFESILTTLMASIVFRGNCGSSKNQLELKIEPLSICKWLKSVKHTAHMICMACNKGVFCFFINGKPEKTYFTMEIFFHLFFLV